MKRLTLSLYPGILFGVLYNGDGEAVLLIPFVALEIHYRP